MNKTINYQDSEVTYIIENGKMHIEGKWIVNKMMQFGWSIVYYNMSKDNELVLYGKCPEENIIKAKKFFYDNYPYVTKIYPIPLGINIEFSLPVTISIN